MKKQQKSKTAQYYVPVALQRLFVFFIIPFYILVIGSTVWTAVTQARQGADIQSQLAYMYGQTLVPALIFILAYAMNPRKLPWLQRSFESLLIAIAAFLGWSLIGELLFTLFFAAINMVDIMKLELYNYVSFTAFLVVFIALLFYLRVRGKWA